MRLCHGLTSESAIERIDSTDERRLLFARTLEAQICEELHVTVGDVGKRLRRRARIRCGHVCHAIMRYALLDVNRIEMCGWSRGFSATALIDRDIHEHAAALHLSQHCTRDQ